MFIYLYKIKINLGHCTSLFTAKIHPPGTNHRGVNLDIGFKVQVVASVRVVSVPESPGVTISTVPARQTPPRAGLRARCPASVLVEGYHLACHLTVNWKCQWPDQMLSSLRLSDCDCWAVIVGALGTGQRRGQPCILA